MKTTIIKLLLIGLSLFLFSCTSDKVTYNPIQADVYVSGVKNNHACYWKNNLFVPLNDIGFSNSSADTIIVVNNDIHILGTGYETSGKQLYWKNNIMTNLTDSYSTSSDIVEQIGGMDVDVATNDVYIVGITRNLISSPSTFDLVYWKNDVKYNVATYYSMPYGKIGILFFNNNIYISFPKEISGTLTSGYFINTVFYPLNNVYLGGVTSISSDIYVYGRTDQYLGYYKNLMTNTETSFPVLSHIYKMCFDNGNVYSADGRSIFENGNTFYTIPTPAITFNYYNMFNYEIKNNTTYILTEVGEVGPNYFINQKLLVDNVVTMQNNVDEKFKSLFVD